MRKLAYIEDVAVGLILWSLFLTVGLQFFTRYVLNDSLGWTEEIARMMLIVLTYFGAAVCARKHTHIQVDLFLATLPERSRVAVSRSYDLISAGLFAFLAWTAVKFALRTRLMMSSIELPKSIIYWLCAVALVLMAFHSFVHFLRPSGASQDEITS